MYVTYVCYVCMLCMYCMYVMLRMYVCIYVMYVVCNVCMHVMYACMYVCVCTSLFKPIIFLKIRVFSVIRPYEGKRFMLSSINHLIDTCDTFSMRCSHAPKSFLYILPGQEDPNILRKRPVRTFDSSIS